MIITDNPAISVTLFRVTSGHDENNGKAIDLIVDCPTGYAFTECTLEVKRADGASDLYDLSAALFENKYANHWSIVIPLEMLGIVDNAIYKMYLKALAYEKNEDDEIEWNPDAEITETMYTSDVENTFNCMLSHILNSNECGNLPDDVIRNYLILFGHLSALKQHNVELAWEYFKLLDNCFDKCGTHKHGSTCNCGR